MSPQPCKDSALALSCFYPPVSMASPMIQHALKNELDFLLQLNKSSTMTQSAKEKPSIGLGKALASFGLPKSPSSDLGTKPHLRAPPGLELPSLEHAYEPPGLQPSVEKPTFHLGHATKERHRDPEIQFAREVASRGLGLNGFTTVMLQRVPPSYTHSELAEEIDNNGFAGTYDFFSLPVNSRNDRNRGFAFLNFMSANVAEEFYSKYNGRNLKREGCGSLSVQPSWVQGYDQNVACFLAANSGRKKKRQIWPIGNGNATIEQSRF